MKPIYNWNKATVADFEANGLLREVTKLHVLSCEMYNGTKTSIEGHNHDRIKAFFQYHIDNEIPVIFHNGKTYDVPLAEKILGIDLSKLMCIDTLALSWYLNFLRNRHGLGTFHEDYGIEKPAVDDWEGLSYEEYKHRCEEDVKINKALWLDLKARLIDIYTIAQKEIDAGNVGGKRISEDEVLYIDQYVGSSVTEAINRILTFLMFKMDCARLQEDTGWDVDEEMLDSGIEKLTVEGVAAKAELESVMPRVPKYVDRKKPAKPFLKSGLPSASGLAWAEITGIYESKAVDEFGNLKVKDSSKEGVLKLLSEYEDPNGNSPEQIKAFLYSKGWVPQSFKYEKDEEAFNAWIATKPREGANHQAWKNWKEARPEERAIPQITVAGDEGKELCPSLLELAEEVPEIKVYAKYCVLKHRLGVLNGFKRDLYKGKLQARINGFTNTLRVQHAEIVNLAGVDKLYGSLIRGVLVAGKGKISIGSDLSSLEDRCKHSFMLPYDPEYVATLQEEDFDPHILMALTAGMITKDEFNRFKAGDKTANAKAARKKGKTCLPIDTTEILTDSGWKFYEQLLPTDKVLAFNEAKGESEFCNVLGTVMYEEQETKDIYGRSWSLEATDNHRWIVNTGKTNNPTLRYKETSELLAHNSLLVSAPFVGGSSHVTPKQAALVAWILSDGYLNVSEAKGVTSQGLDNSRQGFKCSIAQSKKKYYTEVKELIEDCGIEYIQYVNNSGVDVFDLKSKSIRQFWDSLGLERKSKHEQDYTKFILGLSKDSLVSFYEAFKKADGLTSERFKALNYKTDVFYQNKGGIQKALGLVCYLLGRNTYTKKRSNSVNCMNINSRSSGFQSLQRFHVDDNRVTDVFCLTTELGNFVVRQGDYITITGNCNYASVYNAGAAKIAQAAGVPLSEGKALHEAYWKLNWAVKAVAEEQVVIKDSRGDKWLINPINGFCYSLRKESDRFSTLCQGTGSFFFDMWVDTMLDKMYTKYGRKTLTGSMHDEVIIIINNIEKYKGEFTTLIKESIEVVNEKYKLRRKLGCEVQFGYRYSEIH